MCRPDLNEGLTLRDLVIRVADAPSDANCAAFRDALPTAMLFVKLIGVPKPTTPGERYVVPKGGDVRIPYARLPNGMQVVRASAAPPRDVAADQVVATMTGQEVLRLVMQTPAQGLLVAAEDERNSWTAIARDGIASVLKGL